MQRGPVMLQEVIYTKNLVLEPMNVNVEALGAWRVLQGQSALGFVLACKADNAVALNFCLTVRSQPFQREIVRSLTDMVFLTFPCDRLETRIALRDSYLREALMDEGYIPGPACSVPDGDGDPVTQVPLYLSRFDWYGLETSRPFADVNVIEGETIDLHCSYILEANVEKGYVPAYCFEIAPHGELQTVGRIDLRLGYTEKTYYGGNIGYGLQQAWRGHGYAAEACRMLLPLIRRHGMKRVVITCRPDNLPSCGTCENLGAMYVRRLVLPEHTELYQKGDREIVIYHWDVKK